MIVAETLKVFTLDCLEADHVSNYLLVGKPWLSFHCFSIRFFPSYLEVWMWVGTPEPRIYLPGTVFSSTRGPPRGTGRQLAVGPHLLEPGSLLSVFCFWHSCPSPEFWHFPISLDIHIISQLALVLENQSQEDFTPASISFKVRANEVCLPTYTGGRKEHWRNKTQIDKSIWYCCIEIKVMQNISALMLWIFIMTLVSFVTPLECHSLAEHTFLNFIIRSKIS